MVVLKRREKKTVLREWRLGDWRAWESLGTGRIRVARIFTMEQTWIELILYASIIRGVKNSDSSP